MSGTLQHPENCVGPKSAAEMRVLGLPLLMPELLTDPDP